MLTSLKSKYNSHFRKNGLVLMYHRIHTPSVDPWQLSVSPENFEEQLQVLKRFYNVIPVSKLLEQREVNRIKSNSICLTFDDGYADNYFIGRRLLFRYGCPATFFISSGLTGTNDLFWWDELALLLLQPLKLPANLSLIFPGEIFQADINQEVITEAEWVQIKSWKYPQLPAPQRCALYFSLWQLLQPLRHSEIQIVLQQLRVWGAHSPSLDAASYPMTSPQLQSLFGCSLFSAGIHTVSHPALAHQSSEMQKEEILQSTIDLERYRKGIPMPIAYPYGSYNEDTVSTVERLDISAGFTTSPALIHAGSDPLRLGRFQVSDCGGQEFHRQLQAWFANGS